MPSKYKTRKFQNSIPLSFVSQNWAFNRKLLFHLHTSRFLKPFEKSQILSSDTKGTKIDKRDNRQTGSLLPLKETKTPSTKSFRLEKPKQSFQTSPRDGPTSLLLFSLTRYDLTKLTLCFSQIQVCHFEQVENFHVCPFFFEFFCQIVFVNFSHVKTHSPKGSW